jgi:hypothetical protein
MNRLFSSLGFKIHFVTYALVNLLLLAVNLLTTPNQLWFYWPLLGWGIGIVAHGAAEYYAGARRGGIRIAPRQAA